MPDEVITPDAPVETPEVVKPAANAPATPPAEPKMFDEEYVRKLRAEAADYRTKYQSTKATSDGQLKAISKALGLADDEPLDPAKLAAERDSLARENRDLKVGNAVDSAARKHGADTDLLIPYLKGSGALDALDPASATFGKDLAEIVKGLVEKNPKLRAAQVAGRSGTEFPGGAQTVQQLTLEQVKKMTPDQINKARESGALDQLMATGK